MADDLHPVLARQLNKCGFSEKELADEKLNFLIQKINIAYHDNDNTRYLTERAMNISSIEMKQLFQLIKNEKTALELALKDLIEKEKIISENNSQLIIQTNYASSLISSIPDMLIVTDLLMKITDVNTETTKLFQANKADVIGINIDKYITDMTFINKMIADKKSSPQERESHTSYITNMSLKFPKTIPVLLSASIIFDNEFTPKGLIFILKDISELKKLEKENAEKMVVVAHAGRLAALGEMATGVAHELNQPLSIIRTNTQTLEIIGVENLTTEKIEEIISSTNRQIERATKIIDHMRSFGRKQENNLTLISAEEPINAAISLFNEQFRLHEIELILTIDNDIPQMMADEQQIEQVMVNLLSNARHAVETMRAKMGRSFAMKIAVNLHYIEAKNEIILEVTDNGIGMSADVFEHCFEPFYTTKEVGEGTGLGLSIIYALIKELKGTIKVDSQPDHGATVSIRLPIGV